MGIEKLIHRRVGEAIRKHRMIEPGDRVLNAISGGKDSAVLATVLADKRRYIPIDFDLFGCHVVTDLAPRSEEKEGRLDRFFEEIGVPLERRFAKVLGRLDKSRPMNCFFCAMQRRKVLLAVALERGCNKIAYGHHMDDIIETLFLNMLYKAEISTMPVRLELDNYEITIVRPLCKVKEMEVKLFATRFGIPHDTEQCPYAAEGRRARVKALISELAKDERRVRDNLFASLGRVKSGYLVEKIRD